MKSFRKVTMVAALLIIVSFGMLFWLWPKGQPLPVMGSVVPFDVQTVHGENYQSDNNKVKIVSFFYLNCPDICPLTMKDIKSLQDKLKERAIFDSKVELISITLNPHEDTDEAIKKYAAAFQADTDGWKWIRFNEGETRKVSEDFKMYYKKLDSGYMAHSTTLYLVDKDLKIRALYDMANSKVKLDEDKIIEDILLLLNPN